MVDTFFCFGGAENSSRCKREAEEGERFNSNINLINEIEISENCRSPKFNTRRTQVSANDRIPDSTHLLSAKMPFLFLFIFCNNRAQVKSNLHLHCSYFPHYHTPRTHPLEKTVKSKSFIKNCTLLKGNLDSSNH